MSNSFLEIHTSDRIAFKRCRRKWDFASPLRQHLQLTGEPNHNLWFGTGFHFALEDYHGYHMFVHPGDALVAYRRAFREEELPDDHEELIELGFKMLDHYTYWERHREKFDTVWRNGKPLVECRFALELIDLSNMCGRPVVYRGTFDRVVKDESGELWIEDYKTAAQIDQNKLATDPQISAYAWAGEQYFQEEIAGVLYTQFSKSVPEEPNILKSGLPSLAATQKTNHRKYQQVVEDIFGEDVPPRYVEFLNVLADQETYEGDRYIRRDKVYRNLNSKLATYKHIINEGKEMLDPAISIYPNPTRDCAWDCPFREVCLLQEEGEEEEWRYQLTNFFREKEEESDLWREKIQWPK
jgi:RecB family exonuclease